MANNTAVYQGPLLENVRKELGLTQVAYCVLLGVSRQWYARWCENSEITLEYLCLWAVDYAGQPIGRMAVDLLKKSGQEKFIPCVCQTHVFDNGDCPKHGNSNVVGELVKIGSEVMA